MKKISIIGSGGAGKSTLAVRLGEVTGIPVYHLDSLFWKPGWVETDRSEWIHIQESICSRKTWIMDGNYGGTLDIRLKASDTIVFLDYNRYLCLFRAISRRIKFYGKTRPDMAQGCKEQLDLEFAKWILSYPSTKRPRIMEKLEKLVNEKSIVILKSDKEANDFLLSTACFEELRQFQL